jgi:3-oxoacyl-[acyl-carrier-protein] synthase-3
MQLERGSDNGASQTMGVRIAGVGAEVPPDVITSAEMERRAGLERFGFEPGWLERVTGVKERHWAPGVMPSELAARAGASALAAADVGPLDVDTLVFAGITRDIIEPATANLVAERLGATNARVFDLINACNGMVDGLDVADSLIRTGKAHRVLVTTGERTSWVVKWNPQSAEEAVRAVASLCLGDGGGAFLVERCDDPNRGLRERAFRSDATQWRHAVALQTRPESEACPQCGNHLDRPFICHGKALFTSSFALLFPMMISVMERSGWGPRDLDLVFCHLPSRRFVDDGLEGIGGFAKFASKLWQNVERYGNMSTVTLPLAMYEAEQAGALKPGAKVLALAPSSGISAAALTMVW